MNTWTHRTWTHENAVTQSFTCKWHKSGYCDRSHAGVFKSRLLVVFFNPRIQAGIGPNTGISSAHEKSDRGKEEYTYTHKSIYGVVVVIGYSLSYLSMCCLLCYLGLGQERNRAKSKTDYDRSGTKPHPDCVGRGILLCFPPNCPNPLMGTFNTARSVPD